MERTPTQASIGAPTSAEVTQEERTQRDVAHARAHVLAGRGPGARGTETQRHQRERPTLGSRPSPLERELVHLNTAAFRAGEVTDVDAATVRNQWNRFADVWKARGPSSEVPTATRYRGWMGFVLGVAVASVLSWWTDRRP